GVRPGGGRGEEREPAQDPGAPHEKLAHGHLSPYVLCHRPGNSPGRGLSYPTGFYRKRGAVATVGRRPMRATCQARDVSDVSGPVRTWRRPTHPPTEDDMADRFLATPLLAVTLTAAGCGAGQTSMQADGARVDTIAGVVHVTNGARGAWDDDAAWEVDVERAVRIGVVDGEAEYVFGRIGGVWVAPDGRIFVGDAQAREIRIFSTEGEFVGRLGRTGEGPGEFRHVDGIGAAPGGGVAVLDGMLNRVSVFDGDGAFRRMFRLA